MGEKKECWVALSKIIEQGKVDNQEIVVYFKTEILPKIKDELQKMEQDIQSVQHQFHSFPASLQLYLPDFITSFKPAK